MSKEEALRRIKEAAETGATELNLSKQDLTELPPELFQLTNLQILYLSRNQLSSLPPQIDQLKNLTKLGLAANLLTSLPPEFFELKNLTNLNLSYNQLDSLPPELSNLKKLPILNVQGNRLISFPPEIVQLSKLKKIYFLDNPLSSPPYELAVHGIEAIREYFAEVEGETKEVAEVKVILVGEGASGKTSLTRCLKGEKFDKHEPTTHGIRIEELTLAGPSRSIRCKLWDFGGQEIMHAMHQFFLSRRSLYVLVLDGRRDERPEHWLRYIETFGGRSPVLVVLNKYDTNPSFDLNQRFLKEKYQFIVDFYRTSCPRKYGIEELRQAMTVELDKLPMTKNQWPECWFRAKERLEQENEPRISYEKFEEICVQAGVDSETSQAVLADFLHDLGSVIRFKDFGLDGNNVLDPKWVTGAVYKIINAETVAAGNGVLRLDDLKELLRWKEGDEHRYERRDYPYFIELMKKFELCYQLDDEQVLIPQLLPVPEPSFTFDETGALRFCVDYGEFLPASIMPRFIVKRHHEIKDKLRWRTGVVLENPLLEAAALIRADVEARRIHIVVTGTQPKAFLTVILLTLREINSGFEGLTVSERIPLPDNPSVSVDCKTLRSNLEQEVMRFVPEGASKAYNVQELLSIVDEERILKLLQEIRGEAGDKESFMKLLWSKVKIEPEFMGVGGDVKGLAEELWQRYSPWRGKNNPAQPCGRISN